MLEVQHPMDYFKKEREVNEPVEGEQHTEQISKSHKFERNRRVDTHFSIGQQGLQLPENFERGEVVGRGDCFFDSFRQGLEQQKGIEVTVKQLREDCRNFARSSPPEWFINTIANSHDNNGEVRSETPDSYIGNILNSDRWGDPEVEGRILCQKYNVKLHITERHIVEEQKIWAHQIVDESGSRSTNEINYNEANTIHIVNEGKSHFQPILKTGNTAQVSNIDEKDENPEPMEVEQPGTSERAGKKRPSIWEEDQLMVKKTILSPQEEDKMKEVQDLLYVFVEAFIDNFAIDLAGHNLRARGKKVTVESLVEEVVTGVTGGLVGITIGWSIGGFIPSAVASSRGLISQLLNMGKEKATKITNAFAKVRKGDLSEILAEAATKIFHSFESQFTNLKHDAGDELLMKMLAEDAVKRALNYIAENSQDISSDFIMKGVILGKSEKVIDIQLTKLKFLSKGEKVKDADDDSKIEIGELYEKTGITIVNESDQPSYYRKSTVLDGSKYGYRLALKWEEESIYSEDGQYTLEEFLSEETKYQCSSRRYEYILKKEGVAQEASQVLSKMKDKAPAKTGDMNAIKEEILNRLEANQKEPHNQPPPKGTMFDLNKPIENFTGRKKDLEDLHEKLSGQSVVAIAQKISELSINSQTSNLGNLGSNSQQASVSGLGGIGKTQLALKYAEKYSTDYDNNVIWINAQDEGTISDSFKRLASKLGIAKKDVDNDEKKTHDLAQEIYEHFKEAKSLFIFDNVENYQQIEKYLPKQFVDNKSSILITSRYRNWENTRVEVLDLNVFTLEEAKEFIKTKLEIASGDSSQDEEINALAEKLERLPLALAQAVAYVKQSKNTNSEFGINDYLAIYDEKNKQLLGSDALEKSNDPYTKTVLTTWQVTLDKIKEKGVDGKKAIEILNIMAYFNPDKISNKIFSQLESSGNVNGAIQLLKDYSMINEAKPSESDIHRLVQEVVRINLKDENKEKDILEKAIEILNKTKKGGPKTRHQGDKPLSKSNEIHAAIVCYYAGQYPDLENQVNVLFGDLHDSHILTYFAKKGNHKLLSKILQNDQEAKNKALLQAKNYEIAEILVSHGANIDDPEITNLQNSHILRALLKADKIDQKKKNQYLFGAVFANESKLVELLMKYGADLDAKAEAYLERDDDQSPILDKDDTISGATSKLPKISKKIISLLRKEKYRDSDDSQHSSESKDKTSEEEELPDIDEFSTPTECSLPQRKKRSANVLCWNNIDKFNEADEPDKSDKMPLSSLNSIAIEPLNGKNLFKISSIE